MNALRTIGQEEAPESRGTGRVATVGHWTTAPPSVGDVQTWYAPMAHLLNQYRARQDEAGTLARTLERELGALWTCVVEAGVEPTNNRAERALRFAVLWRKLMQGSDNEKGDRWVERILSLRETCRLRGMPTFPVLVEAVTCAFNGQHPDVSWISWIRPPEPLRFRALAANPLAGIAREDLQPEGIRSVVHGHTWPEPPLPPWGVKSTHLHRSAGRHLPRAVMPKYLKDKTQI